MASAKYSREMNERASTQTPHDSSSESSDFEEDSDDDDFLELEDEDEDFLELNVSFFKSTSYIFIKTIIMPNEQLSNKKLRCIILK